jgi:CubicO group peptidase (beta-lactamase class C family)
MLLCASAFSTPARAQKALVRDGAVAVRAFDAALRDWMSEHQVPAASLAAMKSGRIVSTLGYGGMQATSAARIASLSKAITAVCVARLIDERRLSFNAPLGKVLANQFRALGQPVDPRFKAITIEQLLTHRAGLKREAIDGRHTHDMASHFLRALATPLEAQPGGDMSYSNIGYLTLGMVTEAVTGADYERYCRNASLAPMQATGAIDPQLRARAPNGGWRVSALDYARFMQVFEPGPAGLGSASRQWQQSLGDKAYGLGVGIRRSADGVVLSHSGRVAARERGGAYQVKFDNGWTVVVTFAGDPTGSGTRDLRKRLEAAVAAP